MVEYTDYDPADGRIIQSGFCPNEDCLPALAEGAVRLMGVVGRPEQDVVIDGEIHANQG